jgi:anti-sigma regulatory factor (Ser/Thr protein kinase)
MESFGTELPATPSAPSLVRGWLRATLQTWRLDGFGDVTELLTSELVSNVVNHVRAPMSVRVSRSSSSIRVEVDDPSPIAPTLHHAGASDEHHRGMFIVESFANRWGSIGHPDDGKTVWFELDVDPDAAHA